MICNQRGEPSITQGDEVEQQESDDRQPGKKADNRSGNTRKQKSPIDRRRETKKIGEITQHKLTSNKIDGQQGDVIPLSTAPPIPYSPLNEYPEFTNSALGYAPPDEEPADKPVSQWLKSLLPEASGGWWDVYPKDNGFAVKFRWRDQGRQTLSFPRISYLELQELRECSIDVAIRIMGERISGSLHRLLLDQNKLDKALFVAQKLGINICRNVNDG